MDYTNVFLDDQPIVTHEGFQNVILILPPLLLLLLVPTFKWNRQEGVETMGIVCKFRSSCTEVLYKNSCSKMFDCFQENIRGGVLY